MPVYFLKGEEELLAREWIEKNLETWIGDVSWRPFNYHVLDAKEGSLEEIANLIQSFPMGSPRRVVVLKNVSGVDAARSRKLAGLATDVPDTTILIFWLISSPADSRKSLPKEFEEIEKKGQTVSFTLKKTDRSKWLKEAMKEKGLELTREGEEFLLENTGGDLGKLEMELSKLATFSPKATSADLESLASGEKESSMFDLLDGIGERVPAKAFCALNGLLEQGEPPIRILATIGGHVRLLWQIKTLQEERRSSSEIAKTLGIHPYRVTKGMAHCRNFKNEEFPKFLEWIVRADWNLKTGKQEPRHMLELILARACSPR